MIKGYKYNGHSDSGLFEWLLQRVSGVILIVVIAVHFFSMIKSGEWGLKSIVLGPLFAFGIFHTLNGFKMITDDYVKSTIWRAIILAIYWIVGVTAAVLALKVVSGL